MIKLYRCSSQHESGYLVFSLGKRTGATANTREVTSFLVWAHIKKIINKKKRRRKIQKNKKKSKKSKIEKEKKKNKEPCIRVEGLLDKIGVLGLGPIPDSQKCAKRGSCRHLILSETSWIKCA